MNYYDKVYGRKLVEAIDREMKRKNNNVAGNAVLDYGCGSRPYEKFFTDRGYKYIGADILGNRHADVQFTPNQPIEFEDESFDVVLSTQVLEHVKDVSGYLSECRRILKPNGLLLLSTHGTWKYHGHPEDYYRWTFWGLRSEITDARFSVENMSPCIGPLAYTTMLRTQLLRGFLTKYIPFSSPLVFLANLWSSCIMPLQDKITPEKFLFENAAVYIVEAYK
ncbi:MAG: class I SAM-dependent methyltransferase [Thermoguttaceae bacterium]